MSKLSIGHIINPVVAEPGSDLHVAQPITFETMKVAREYAREEIDLCQYAAFFPEDEKSVPPGFEKTGVLERSILDLKSFKVKRKLPLLKDILDRLYEASGAEYFIYTNVDIALMPYFYLTVKRMIEAGYDAFLINRRTLAKTYRSISQLPLMYADCGEKHPGHDCFVFKREAYNHFILGDSCIGARLIARFIMSNMIAYSKQYKIFTEVHTTFHIGDEQRWMERDSHDYYYHHVTELMKVLEQLVNNPHVVNKLGLLEFFKFNVWQIWREASHYPETHYLENVPAVNEVTQKFLQKNEKISQK